MTLILSLLFGSGGEHCDLALAVEVRACCSGLVASEEYCDLVAVRRGTL